jgi:uncharacterized membrane protein YuzA (DUF378 family)
MCGGNCHGGGCVVSKIGKILLAVGGLNWGLVGVGMLMGKLDEWNVVKMLLGTMPTWEAVVYVLVGVSALLYIIGCKCKKCKAACSTCAVGGGSGTPGQM